MTVEHELAHAGGDELRAIAARGVHGGELYLAAVTELERRAHESEAALEAQKVAAATHRQHQILGLAVLVLVAATAFVLIAPMLGL